MTAAPPRRKSDAAGRYSGSDQQNVPDFGHADHEQGTAAGKTSRPEGKPWRGPPHQAEGQYGYRRDEGTHSIQVDGDVPRAPKPHHKA